MDAEPDQRTISREAARRFLVARQGLQKGKGKRGALEAIRLLECVQIDPVRIVHRNHDLVLHARVSDYEPSYLEELLYKDRVAFEYWCNEKSIIPVEDFRYFRYRMHNYMDFHSPFFEYVKSKREELKDEIRRVLSAIEANGPLCAKDFRGEAVDGKTANHVLNLLWDCGEVMIHRAEGNLRYYDLTERILPKDLDVETPGREEYERFMVEKYMRAYGLIDVRDWRFGWRSMKSSQRRAIVDGMVREGEVRRVKIEGVKHVYYVLDRYASALEAAEDFPIEEKIHFIAPLDNLLWNRRAVSEIFDFDYAWEIYKVPEKRIYGDYVLPILYGARFIGRMGPQLDRASKTMIIDSLILEKGCPEDVLVAELEDELGRFLRFHEASQIKILNVKPNGLKRTLLAELNRRA